MIKDSITVKNSEGDIVQAFKNQCTIRIFESEEKMNNFMKLTNNAEKSDAYAFMYNVKSMINQYTPVKNEKHLLELVTE